MNKNPKIHFVELTLFPKPKNGDKIVCPICGKRGILRITLEEKSDCISHEIIKKKGPFIIRRNCFTDKFKEEK